MSYHSQGLISVWEKRDQLTGPWEISRNSSLGTRGEIALSWMPRNLTYRGYPAKRALSAMGKHGG